MSLAIEKSSVDRTGWGSGPWDDEADGARWVDEATDLSCMILRNSLGALCGYVGVETSHPLHHKDYCHYLLDGAECHGGLTYAKEDDVGTWWFGFDCSHVYDRMPAMDALRADRDPSEDPSYRDWDYTKRNVERLAKFIHAMGGRADNLSQATDKKDH